MSALQGENSLELPGIFKKFPPVSAFPLKQTLPRLLICAVGGCQLGIHDRGLFQESLQQINTCDTETTRTRVHAHAYTHTHARAYALKRVHARTHTICARTRTRRLTCATHRPKLNTELILDFDWPVENSEFKTQSIC